MNENMRKKDGIGTIHYRWPKDPPDHVREWGIGVLVGVDDEQTLREHLNRWRPGAVWLGCTIKTVPRE